MTSVRPVNSDSDYDEFEIDGKIQKYKNTESFQILWQLVGVWQIDNKKILELGRWLFKHFQKLLGKNIQIICNRQHTCPTLRKCDPVCISAFKDIKNSYCICSECYELKGDHFHVKLNNKEMEYQKRILEIFLPLYFQYLNKNYSDKINTKLEEKDFEKFREIAGNKLYKHLKANQKYLPAGITKYIDVFPKFLKVFFERMFLQLESKKITRSN
ncbi:hypothetical protein RhiirC2_800077 [Rhizophagus irregularis]|uniref:Uncharacterized protein n=1 Tax=Rhizophagus irregularis TaxID=588596 RepID=A0A2N1M437_9GLOM|nr:hypothetical protein RhiirC2_800077 [Rhizophagus irregularis]